MDKILKNIKENGITNIEVFEDINGGLTLAVWCDDEFFCSSGFEYSEGYLVELLKDLQHETPHNWENMKEMTEETYINISSDINYGCVVLNIEGFCNIDAMGVAARKEFAEFLPEQ